MVTFTHTHKFNSVTLQCRNINIPPQEIEIHQAHVAMYFAIQHSSPVSTNCARLHRAYREEKKHRETTGVDKLCKVAQSLPVHTADRTFHRRRGGARALRQASPETPWVEVQDRCPGRSLFANKSRVMSASTPLRRCCAQLSHARFDQSAILDKAVPGGSTRSIASEARASSSSTK